MTAIDPVFVDIGAAGNAADPATGYGQVAEPYRIGKYEVTIGEYVAFLNAVAADDPKQLFNPSMGGDKTSGGIERTTAEDGGFRYRAIGPFGTVTSGADSVTDRPITYVDWMDAARFANWMANDQPTGGQSAATTENGAYDLTSMVTGTLPLRNLTNPNTGQPPAFFLPSENEWYKAAYFSGSKDGGAGYYRFATQADAEPGNVIGESFNQVNYILSTGEMTVTRDPWIDPAQGYLTNIGAMQGSPSAAGTFDQNGNVWEVMESAGMTGSAMILRGGAWTSFTSYLASDYRLGVAATTAASNGGFRLAARAEEVVIDFVPVGDANNTADSVTGFGSVAYDFAIGKTDVTIGQYTVFLNAVAADDPHGLYDPRMASDLAVAGISRIGTAGSYTYRVLDNDGSSANRPITYVDWFDAARFTNWIANGQPVGDQTSGTTENGAYDLTSSDGAEAVPRNAVNPNTAEAPSAFLPTENEWYKAAYYDPTLSDGSGGYFLYATQQNSPPTNNPAAATGPIANYLQGPIYCVTQDEVFSPTQNYLTDVGAFSASPSFYGTLDQNGNVYQWNDLAGERGLYRGLRGGFWAGGEVTLRNSTFTQVTAARAANDTGFRLVAAPPPVPAPVAYLLASNGQWLRVASDGGELTSTVFATWSGQVAWQFPLTADFNGDGRADVAAMTPGGVWWATLDRGDGSSQTVRMTQWSAAAGWVDAVAGDFNGDGLEDIAGRTAGGAWWLATSTGHGFSNSLLAMWRGDIAWHDVLAGDFNGDGRMDIAGRTASGMWWAVITSSGRMAANTPMGRWTPGTYRDVGVADVNGDGHADILGRAVDGTWIAAIAQTSSPGFTSLSVARWAPTAGWQDVRLGDLNGDGRTDIIGRSANGQWWAAYAGGTEVRYDSRPVGFWNPTVDWKHVFLAESNGDGSAELVGLATAGSAAESGSWWQSVIGPASFDTAASGRLLVPQGVTIVATLPTAFLGRRVTFDT